MTAEVVADASPLIAFQQIGQLQLLQSLFTEIAVPSAVVREIQPSVPLVPCHGLTRANSYGLGFGEGGEGMVVFEISHTRSTLFRIDYGSCLMYNFES